MSEAARNLKLILEYDGAGFHGWQVQPDLRTVQGCVIAALRRVTRDGAAGVQGASRTDAGVHAYGQVATARASTAMPALKLRAALNGVLDRDVSVRSVRDMPADFHARFDARGKHYRYLIDNRPWPSPLRRRRSWHRHQPLERGAMEAAGLLLVGRHDFAGFAPSREERSTVRTVTAVAVSELGDGLLAVDVAGDGFLWNMVRTIVGTLVDVGRGKRTAADVRAALELGDRRRAGPTAPAQGLALVKVYYDEAPKIGAAPPEA